MTMGAMEAEARRVIRNADGDTRVALLALARVFDDHLRDMHGVPPLTPAETTRIQERIADSTGTRVR